MGSMSIGGPVGPPDDEKDPRDRPTEDGTVSRPADQDASRQERAGTRSPQEYYDDLRSGRGFEVDSFGSLMAAPPATERPEWEAPLDRAEVDRCGLAVVDGRPKRIS